MAIRNRLYPGAAAEDLDLDAWVAFTATGPPQCGCEDCHAEAVAVAVFHALTPCPHDRKLLCLRHRDVLLVAVPFTAGGVFSCQPCGPGSRLRFVRMEAIR